MRSLLTVLGIIIGVAAVIAMVSISQGASASVQEKIASLGNNMLVILSGSITQGGVRMGLGARPTLTVGDKGRSAGMSGCGCGDVHQASRPAGCGREPELEHDGHRGLLASVASVFLLVGGIGIMNIMLVSVTERTREIGVRMAVGAKSRHILMQVLLEAVALSTIGGVLGVVCGVVGARLLSVLAGWATLLPSEAMVIAVVFSAAVGIFFGFYPARKLPASILFRRSGTNKAGNSTGLWQRRPPGHDTEAVLQGTLHCPVARRRHRHQRYRKNERSQRYFLTAVRSVGMQQG